MKPYLPFGAGSALELRAAVQLLRQQRHKFQSQRIGIVEHAVLGDADAVIADAEGKGAVHMVQQVDMDLPAAVIDERMFQAIGHQFVDDQAAGQSRIDVELDIIDVQLQHDDVGIDSVRTKQVAGQRADVVAHFDPREIAGSMQGLVDRKSTRLNSSHQKISYAV